MSDPSDSQLSPGTMLAHYRVESELGTGAMGTVYRAWDTSLERPVAAKVLHGAIAEEPEIVRRFEREARAAARVNHSNLTHVYFVGADGERPFFVMEYVPGESLYEHVKEHGPMEYGAVLDVLRQAALGLRAAHKGGVIHRDVKPSNIMLLPDGSVKVTDFGLAKSLTGDADATGAGRVMGTPRYMSPEQCRGEPVDTSTDSYSLGLTGYYLLTGKHAFDGESLGKVLSDQMNAPVPPASLYVRELPSSADELIAALCEKKSEDRAGSMDRVLELIAAARPRELDLAPLASRGAAAVVDWFFALVVFGAISAGIALLSAWVEAKLLLRIIDGVLNLVAMFLLFAGMERKFGASPAKLLFQLRVVREDGTPPSWGIHVMRLIVRYPIALLVVYPFQGKAPEMLAIGICLGLQALSVAAGGVCHVLLNRRTVSDVLTRTRVVLARGEQTEVVSPQRS